MSQNYKQSPLGPDPSLLTKMKSGSIPQPSFQLLPTTEPSPWAPLTMPYPYPYCHPPVSHTCHAFPAAIEICIPDILLASCPSLPATFIPLPPSIFCPLPGGPPLSLPPQGTCVHCPPLCPAVWKCQHQCHHLPMSSLTHHPFHCQLNNRFPEEHVLTYFLSGFPLLRAS